MLEILIIIFVGKKVGGIAEEKGYSGILFTLLFVGCWFIGEILGLVLGSLLLHNVGAVYGLALLLAILGGVFAFVLAVVVPGERERRYDSLRRPRGRGKPRKRRRPPEDEEDDSYREKFRPRRRAEVEVLEEVEDEEEIMEVEEIQEAPPRKTLPRSPVRKPDPNRDRYRSGDR